MLAFFAAHCFTVSRDTAMDGRLIGMDSAGTHTAPDNATATPHTSGGNSAPGNATPDTAHDNAQHQAHTEPDNAHDNAPDNTEHDNAPEPDNAAPDTTARTAPERSEQPTHTHTPQPPANHAHATTAGNHDTPAHHATPAIPRKRGRPRKHPLPPPPLPHNALDHIPPNTPAPRLDKPGLPPRVAFSPMPVPIDTDTAARALDIINSATQGEAPAETLEAALMGVERLSKHAPIRAAALIASLAAGLRHKEAYFVSGLNMIDIHLFKQVDKAFSAAYDLACRLQGDCIARAVLDAATERAVEGVDEPVIGRIAKDQDGIITTKKRYSDKLAEVLLKATDSRFRDAAPATQNASTIYNIQVLHPGGHGNGPDDQAPHNSGGKKAAKQQHESQVIDAEALTLD